MSYYDEHGNYTIPCMEVPAVCKDEDGLYVLTPFASGKVHAVDRTSGDLRALGHAFIALAEVRLTEEAAEVEELDRIAMDLFDTPYVSLKPTPRDAVKRVRERYTRNKQAAWE